MSRRIPQRIACRIDAEFISNGRVEAGGRLPSVRDLAELYDCSNSSITAALSILDQNGKVERKHGHGCFVNSLLNGPNAAGGLIGLIGPSTDAELLLHVYDGVERIARRHHRHVMMASSNYDYETEKWQTERMIKSGCQTIVLYPVTRTTGQLKTDYLKTDHRNASIVLVGNAFEEQRRPRIVFDNYHVGYQMTEHLLADGHRHIAFIDNFTEPAGLVHFAVRERYRGYIDAMRAGGAEVRDHDRWFVRAMPTHFDSEAEVKELLLRWKKTVGRPTAVIAIEDRMAIQAICLSQDLGIDVPDDLTIAGFDNRSIGRSFRPPFPTSNPDFRYAGQVAARLAIELEEGQPVSSVVYMIPVSILPRDSHRRTLPNPVSDRVVVTAGA